MTKEEMEVHDALEKGRLWWILEVLPSTARQDDKVYVCQNFSLPLSPDLHLQLQGWPIFFLGFRLGGHTSSEGVRIHRSVKIQMDKFFEEYEGRYRPRCEIVEEPMWVDRLIMRLVHTGEVLCRRWRVKSGRTPRSFGNPPVLTRGVTCEDYLSRYMSYSCWFSSVLNERWLEKPLPLVADIHEFASMLSLKK